VKLSAFHFSLYLVKSEKLIEPDPQNKVKMNIPQNMKMTTKTVATKQKRKNPQQKKMLSSSRTVSAPVATACITQQPAPRIKTAPGKHMITHREYIADIIGSTSGFSVAYSTSINAGLATTAPWLALEAINWEMYKFTKLHFVYETRCATTIPGYVAIAVNYNPDEAPPTTKAQLYTWKGVKTGAPWNVFVHKSSPEMLSTQKDFLVRGQMVAGEFRVYDVGSLYVVCGGQAANSQIGELWIEYSITLRTPQINAPGLPVAQNNSVFNFLTNIALTTGVATNVAFANTVVNALGVTYNAGPVTFTLMAGTYTVYAQVLLTAASLTSAVLGIYKNGVAVQASVFPALNAGSSVCNVQCIVSVTATDNVEIVVLAVGTTLALATGAPAGVQNILQFTPA
jgi:hypothetical protein